MTILVATGLASTADSDVVAYSIIKGEFRIQTGPETVELDPLFGFSVLATVELADFELLESASLRLPEGETLEIEDYGDAASWLDSYETEEALNAAYTWGDYFLAFDTVNEPERTCLMPFPETPLPPSPRLVNFGEMQAVDPSRPLTLTWVFDGTPDPGDFVQVYVNLGHGEVFATPNLGEPGALTSADRTVTLPPDTLVPGYIHSLNLEITRVAATQADCHPEVQGATAVFRSTEIEVFVLAPPVMRWLARPETGLPELEVVADPEQPVVLQASEDLVRWTNFATNAASSGTNVFTLPAGGSGGQFFRSFALWESPESLASKGLPSRRDQSFKRTR